MFSFISSSYISESTLFFWLLSLTLKICLNRCCVSCLNREFRSVNKTVSLRRYLMSFKLDCLSHDSVLFICFETLNILSTTAFSTDSKDEWSSKVVFLRLLTCRVVRACLTLVVMFRMHSVDTIFMIVSFDVYQVTSNAKSDWEESEIMQYVSKIEVRKIQWTWIMILWICFNLRMSFFNILTRRKFLDFLCRWINNDITFQWFYDDHHLIFQSCELWFASSNAWM